MTLPKSTQTGVTKVLIERTASNGSDFYELATVDNGTATYIDATADLDLLANLPSSNETGQPPIYQVVSGSWTQVGGKYLTELNGIFYLAVGNRLYLSKQSNPHAWDTLNWASAADTITALATDRTALLVFTENRTFRVTGTNVTDLVWEDLEVAQGCPNWRTVAYYGNAPVWWSYDGLCVYSNTPNREGRYVTVVTYGKYRFPGQPDHAVVANDVYHAFYSGSDTLCFDARAGLRPFAKSLQADLAFYDINTDRLITKTGSTFYVDETGASIPFEYTSPEFSTNTLVRLKHWQRMWIDSDVPVTIGVYLDGTLKQTKTITGTGRRHVRLVAGLRGERIQFTITGTGTFRGFQLGFTAFGD